LALQRNLNAKPGLSELKNRVNWQYKSTQSALEQKTGVVGVPNALDACAPCDLVRAFVWQPKGLVSHPSCAIFVLHVFAKLDVKYLMQK